MEGWHFPEVIYIVILAFRGFAKNRVSSKQKNKRQLPNPLVVLCLFRRRHLTGGGASMMGIVMPAPWLRAGNGSTARATTSMVRALCNLRNGSTATMWTPRANGFAARK